MTDTQAIDIHVVDEPRFKSNPRINVISKEEFEDRIEKVFAILWETLAKSFGPYGAPTIICNYPSTHVTKDGYTIMKNSSMDASETLTDQSIANLASDICGRLNYTVGDGTTTAIIAANSIYQAYRMMDEKLRAYYVLPRDVIRLFDALKDTILEKMKKEIRPIRSLDTAEMAERIREVVYISSNGDQLITDYIASFYRDLGNPAIACTIAADGVTKAETIEGYSYELSLNDKLYANNDNDTMELVDADVIIFSIKVNKLIYDKILKPLNYESQSRGRHLIVCAPSYDERTMMQTIKNDLNKEYKARKDVNMVLTTFKAFSAHHRRLLSDFAMLMNTTVIDKAICEVLLEKLTAGEHIVQMFDIDARGINGIRCAAINATHDQVVTYMTGTEEEEEMKKKGMSPLNAEGLFPLSKDYVPLGFVRKCSLGMKTSLFSDLVYDQDSYNLALKDAETILKETEDKYAKLGTFTIETAQAQQRLYALRLKMGMIEVGGNSDLSQGLLKDAVDDAVRAANSAFNHGVVLGCNTTLLSVIYESLQAVTYESLQDTSHANSREENITRILLEILFKGFFEVYRTVLGNAFDDTHAPYAYTGNQIVPESYMDSVREWFYKEYGDRFKFLMTENDVASQFDVDIVDKAIIELDALGMDITVQSIIIMYSILIKKVFDVENLKFSENVINSSQTDAEVLTATIDLMGLLIAGNQMIVTGKHNF